MPEFKFPKSKNMFAKNLVKQYKLVPLLDNYFAKEIIGFSMTLNGKAMDDAWHPSGDCTPTPGELYHDAQDHLAGKVGEKKFSKAFPVGHFWHALCQHAVVDMGLADEDAIERRGFRGWGPMGSQAGEVRFFDGIMDPIFWRPYHWCTGMADVAPLILPNDENYLVDFKTMNNRDYGHDNTPMPAWAAKKYEAQINIYMDLFDIPMALIVAIQKDSPHNFKEFSFVRNYELINAIYDKWEFVSECIEAGEEPTTMDDVVFNLDDLYQGPVEQQ